MSRPVPTPPGPDSPWFPKAPETEDADFLGLSGFERALNIRDPGLNEYFFKKSRSSERQLLELGYQMMESDNPHVLNAAGSASAEAAMRRTRPGKAGRLSLTDRLSALELARMAWTNAGKLGAAERANKQFFPTEYEAYRFDFGITHNLSYLPNMELVAQLAGGEEIGDEDWQFGINETKANLVALGEVLTSHEGGVSKIPLRRRGYVYEVLAGMVLQRETDQRIIIPSSLRQDHNPNANLRADLLAVERDSASKTLIQVKGSWDENGRRDKNHRIFVNAHHDLVPSIGKHPLDMVSTVIDDFKGEATEEQSLSLDVLSRVLHCRIADFRARRQK